MISSAKTLLLAIAVGCVSFAQTTTAPATSKNPADATKASAYYNFAMGRLYSELAGAEGSREYVDKAIQYYRDALKADPTASIIAEELTDLYVSIGRLSDALSLAEDLLKQNPDSLDTRRMLGRIYTRALANGPDVKADDPSLRKAIEQYQKITQKDPKDIESWVVLGHLYMVSANSPEAEKSFNEALKIDPENEDALTYLAKLYSDQGDSKRAIEKLRTVTDKNPSARTLIHLAQAYEDLKDWKSAADALQKAKELAPEAEADRLSRSLARDLLFSDQLDQALPIYQQLATEEPRDPEPPLRLAEIYRAKHDFVKAREFLNKAKKLDPDNLTMRFEEINLLQAEGNAGEATVALKTLLDDTAKKSYSAEEAKERAELYEQLGVFYRTAGQTPQAVDAFKQMGVVDKSQAARGATEIVETYRTQKDAANALKEADAAVKKFPGERIVVLEHAEVLADQGKIDDAAAEVRGLMKTGKSDQAFPNQLALATIYERGKRFGDMAKVLDDAEKLAASPDDKQNVHFQRGAMYERMKKFDASESEFRKVLELNPAHAGAMNYLGYMLADRGVRLDEAYQLVKKALELEPDNGAYLDSLGWVYFRQGKLNEAEGVTVKALDLIGGQDPTVHDHLGDIYSKEGKTKEAIAQWQASMKEFQATTQAEADPDEVAKVAKKLDDARVRLAQENKR